MIVNMINTYYRKKNRFENIKPKNNVWKVKTGELIMILVELYVPITLCCSIRYKLLYNKDWNALNNSMFTKFFISVLYFLLNFNYFIYNSFCYF